MRMIFQSPSTTACAPLTDSPHFGERAVLAPVASSEFGVSSVVAEKPDFREVLRAMHVNQAKAHAESSAHWRRVAKEALDKDHVDASAFALMMSDLLAGYAAEECEAARKYPGN